MLRVKETRFFGRGYDLRKSSEPVLGIFLLLLDEMLCQAQNDVKSVLCQYSGNVFDFFYLYLRFALACVL